MPAVIQEIQVGKIPYCGFQREAGSELFNLRLGEWLKRYLYTVQSFGGVLLFFPLSQTLISALIRTDIFYVFGYV